MFEEFHPTKYERLIFNSGIDPLQASVLSATARSLRITHISPDDEQSVVNETASGFVAPFVFLYVWWVLCEAKKKGLKRLYFLARDGQIFYKVADLLVKEWSLNVDVRYLYCSRESLLLPSFEQGGAFERNWLTWGYLNSITLNEFCERLRINVFDLHSIQAFRNLSAYFDDPTQIIGREDMPAFLCAIATHEFSEFVREKIRPLTDLTLSYLVQEGIDGEEPFAVVDTGWRGSSQYAISALMKKGGIRPVDGIKGYYVGLNFDVFKYGNDQLHSFLFDWRKERRDYRLYNFICFEMLFSADHGRTTNYIYEKLRVIPVVNDVVNNKYKKIIDIHHYLSVEFARRSSKVLQFSQFDSRYVSACRQLARKFISTPSFGESDLYGEWPNASEIREGDYQPIAPAMTLRSFLRCALGQDKIKGFWPQASLSRGGLNSAMLLYNLFLDTGLLDWYRRVFLRY